VGSCATRPLWYRALPIGTLIASGCSLFVPTDDEYVGGPGAGGSPAGAGGESGSGGTAGTASGASGGLSGMGGVGGSSGLAGSGGATCVSSVSELVPLVPAAYLIMDRTPSMLANNKWTTARNGVLSYGQNADPKSEAALQYFPPLEVEGTCAGTPYDTPEIAFAPIATNAQAIQLSLFGAQPTLLTQSSHLLGVLAGGTQYAVATAADRRDLQLSLVLITDWTGTTDDCPSQTTILAGLTRAAAMADPPATTHVLALQGSNHSVLSSIAKAGGSLQASIVMSDAEVRAGLERAAWPCRFAMPKAFQGATLSATAMAGAQPTELVQVAAASACSAARFHVSESEPYALTLCPEVCFGSSQPVSVELTVACSD
jgi:hypothetical protein